MRYAVRYVRIVQMCVLVTLCSAIAVFGAQAAGFDTKAERAILIDAGSGKVLFEKDADSLMPPASMSKLMTMTMVFEALKRGN